MRYGRYCRDDALAVDERERRRRRRAVAQHGLVADRHGDGFRQAVELAPGLLDSRLLLGAVLVVVAGRRDEGHALRRVLLDGPFEARRLRLAVAAGLPPEVEHDGLPAQRLEAREVGANTIFGADRGRLLPDELDLVAALLDPGAQVVRRLLLRPRVLVEKPERFGFLSRGHEGLRLDLDRRAERVLRPGGVLPVGRRAELRDRELARRLRVLGGRRPVLHQRRTARQPCETQEVLAVLALLGAMDLEDRLRARQVPGRDLHPDEPEIDHLWARGRGRCGSRGGLLGEDGGGDEDGEQGSHREGTLHRGLLRSTASEPGAGVSIPGETPCDSFF